MSAIGETRDKNRAEFSKHWKTIFKTLGPSTVKGVAICSTTKLYFLGTTVKRRVVGGQNSKTWGRRAIKVAHKSKSRMEASETSEASAAFRDVGVGVFPITMAVSSMNDKRAV